MDTGQISNMQAVVDAGRASTDIDKRIAVFGDDLIPVAITAQGLVKVADDVLQQVDLRAVAPKRRKGFVSLSEPQSFIDFVKRFRQDESLIFADPRIFQLTAVLNAHPKGPDKDKAGWCDWGATYACPRSPEWDFWTKLDGKPMSQEAFAELIDARLDDLTSGADHDNEPYPAPLDVLTMARNLMVRVHGQFTRTIDPTTGTGTLVNKTEHGAESTKIYRAFCLRLRVFDGGELYRVEARVRFALSEGRANFSFVLHRRSEIERDAFDGVRFEVAEATGLPVLAGVPPVR